MALGRLGGLWANGNFSHFATGFLLGVSIAFLIWVWRGRRVAPRGEDQTRPDILQSPRSPVPQAKRRNRDCAVTYSSAATFATVSGLRVYGRARRIVASLAGVSGILLPFRFGVLEKGAVTHEQSCHCSLAGHHADLLRLWVEFEFEFECQYKWHVVGSPSNSSSVNSFAFMTHLIVNADGSLGTTSFTLTLDNSPCSLAVRPKAAHSRSWGISMARCQGNFTMS